MCISIVILTIVLTASVATAQDLGNTMPVKTDTHVTSDPVSDGREGGETIYDAYPIAGLPFSDTGATCDNIDDYEEFCPYSASAAPDVIYRWEATFDGELFVDLCGSLYDTQVFMYDGNMSLIDCNDDYYYDDVCGIYTSALENAPVENGMTYYIVVDGYIGCCGVYLLYVEEYIESPPCYLDCSEGAELEGEPPLHNGYQDHWNGGCNSEPPIFQWLTCNEFCGVAGWYDSTTRDTDWLECTAAGTTVIWVVDAESETNCYQLSIPDCDNASVILNMTVGPCAPGTLVMSTTPGEIIHLWVGSANYSNPGDIVGNEYDYVFTIEGIEEVSAVQTTTWSSVKSLYR